MIQKLLDKFLPRWYWYCYCRNFRKDGLLEISVESVLAAKFIFDLRGIKPISKLKCRDYYIEPPIDSLYNLLYYLKEATNLLDKKGELPSKESIGMENIRLDQWMEMPNDCGWTGIDLLEAVKLVGNYISHIVENKGDIPDTYTDRRLKRSLECYLIMVELLGEVNYGNS